MLSTLGYIHPPKQSHSRTAGRCHRIVLATRGLLDLHACPRRPCCPPWHARSSSGLFLVPLELHCQSDQREHGTENFRTTGLTALARQNRFHCCFGVVCRVSCTCTRPDTFAAAFSRCHWGRQSRQSWSHDCRHALNECRWLLRFTFATMWSGEPCQSVDGLFSSTHNRSLTHWEAQTAHRPRDEHPFIFVCELQTNNVSCWLMLACACAPGVVQQENS